MLEMSAPESLNLHRTQFTIHVRLNPNSITRDNGIEILVAWMLIEKKNNSKRAIQQQTTKRN